MGLYLVTNIFFLGWFSAMLGRNRCSRFHLIMEPIYQLWTIIMGNILFISKHSVRFDSSPYYYDKKLGYVFFCFYSVNLRQKDLLVKFSYVKEGPVSLALTPYLVYCYLQYLCYTTTVRHRYTVRKPTTREMLS